MVVIMVQEVLHEFRGLPKNLDIIVEFNFKNAYI